MYNVLHPFFNKDVEILKQRLMRVPVCVSLCAAGLGSAQDVQSETHAHADVIVSKMDNLPNELYLPQKEGHMFHT